MTSIHPDPMQSSRDNGSRPLYRICRLAEVVCPDNNCTPVFSLCQKRAIMPTKESRNQHSTRKAMTLKVHHQVSQIFLRESIVASASSAICPLTSFNASTAA